MIKAVIFDMYETLITLWHGKPYMGHEMSAEAGIPEVIFREIWDTTEAERTLGKMTCEEVVEKILRVNHRYSEELYKTLVEKRRAAKVECFQYMHPDVIPMLEVLKARGIKIGLITNCFSEEREAIHKSVLFPYFDAACMSCELGIKKPDREIFEICLDKLGVLPEECLYCGDGGSNELEVAQSFHMKPVQARWYLQEGVRQPVGVLPQFTGEDNPMELLELLDESGW